MYFRAAVQNANCPIALSGIDTVTVSDVTPPVVICPLNDTLYTPVSACTSPYSVPATIGTDNCPGAMITGNIYVAVAGGGSVAVNGIEVQTAGPLALGAGSVIALPLGIHQFTDTLFDGSGNHTVCNWSITVLDNTPPTIACPPSPVDLNSAVGSCSGVLIDLLNLVTIGGDNCSTDADLLLTQTPAAGTVMNDGDPATVIVADGSGNSSTCTFSIQVLDTEPPVFDNCPSPSDQEFNPPMGACSHRYVFPTINSTDNCDPDTESDYQTFLREEGNPIWQDVTGQTDHVLAAGTHLLYEVHTDDAGNADTCHWTVTVRDDEAPVITVPADIIVSADGNACGAMVNFAVGVSDNCAVLDTTFSHASGSSFPVGSTTVTVDANDIHGNAAAQASFTITVVDNTAPTITCPGNVSRNISNLGTCTGAASWAQPVFSDDCGSSTLFQTAGLASGSQFPLGLHPITYTVQDAAGNTASCSFTVAINDISAPTITCPLYDTLPIPLGPGCSLSFPDLRDSLTVTDCSPWTNTMVPAAGTLFTQDTVLYVTMWVEDSAGNGIWNDHWVHIADLAPPTINCPSDISVNADPGACGAVVNYVVPTGTDNCAATTIAMTAGLASGSFFPVGTTTMSYLVTDAAGLTASCSFSVTATDNSIPALVNCPMDMVITAAPGACDAVANWTEPIVSDNCSATLTRTGPASGSSFAVGTTTTITYSATDGNNTATCGFNVTVIAPVVDLVYGTTTACQGSAVIMPSMATPAGGTFIDADQSGTVDPSTGAFDPSIATPGPHTIGYTLSGDCTILDWFTVTVVAVPTASILYAASPYCSGTGTATVSRTGATGGSYSSTAGLAINVWTGDVDLAASTPGNYTVTYTIATGGVCGEFSTTAPITITPSSSNTTTASACDNYTWSVDGQSYTASGTYTSVSGCHTETLVLTITPSTSNTTTASACDSYTWSVDGQSPSTSNTTTVSACDSYTWSVDGQTYTASGTYTSVSGCHTETLVLTITPSTSNTTTASACDSYTWSVDGQTYTASGTYTSVSGCHTETLVLTITPSTSNTTTVSACDSYTWSVDGQTYTASGTYTSVSGCHTETLVLTITPSTSNTTTASACDSYTWSVDGQTYTASGTYTSVSGCHTETLVLTITPSTSNTTTASACDTYTWSVDGQTYTTSGTYTSMSGCHTETLVLTITPSLSPTWTSPGAVCSNDPSISLTGLATVQGGAWSGVGVFGTSFYPGAVTGSSLVTYTIGTGDCARSETHQIVVNMAPIADAGTDRSVCGFETTMNAHLVSGTGTWTTGSAVLISAPNIDSSLVSAAQAGTYTLTWTVVQDGCSASDTALVTFHDPVVGLIVNAGPDQTLEVNTSTMIEAEVPEGVSVNWSVISGAGIFAQADAPTTQVEELALGLNVILIHATLGECPAGSDTLRIEVKDFFVPAGFSPNADGVNDQFVITGMAQYPGSRLLVFNRWGQKVYDNASYDNSWDGRGENGTDLPDDTYFYTLNLNGDDTYNGYIVIKR